MTAPVSLTPRVVVLEKMAIALLQKSQRALQRLIVDEFYLFQQCRHSGIYKRRGGKPPELARTWKQRLEEITSQDPVLHARVNIGFPFKKLTRKEMRAMTAQIDNRDMAELERLARTRELSVPIGNVETDDFDEYGRHHLFRIASHYGIFQDLFEDGYFYPSTQLHVGFNDKQDDGLVNPVFNGNILNPSEVDIIPNVVFKAEPGKLYTICMTAPDSHLQDNNLEYLHWMVGNIPGSTISDGEVLCDYLQPFPVKGTGNHRYVFILYQHESSIDFSQEKRPDKCTSLKERTFHTFEFYRKHQDELTPVGLAFFQSQWEKSVRGFFHNVLDMEEPSFEFIPPPKHLPKQKLWPIREPFNVYMDQYRDVKDINEEVLREKLKMTEPFKPRPAPKRFPNVGDLPKDTPSWLRIKLREKHNKLSYWKGLND